MMEETVKHDSLDGSRLLITGGTGSLGNALVEEIHKFFKPEKVIIFSRNEHNQHLMSQRYASLPWIRFLLGDVRDRERLMRCFEKVDYVVHAAALKHISIVEHNPLEAIKTNILGSMNVVEACLDKGVKRAVLVSTDKVPNPRNLYGATKFTAERLFLAANVYGRTQYRFVRYGNVLNSHGSVAELFLNLKAQGIHEFPISHLDCSRFWITLEQAAQAVITVLTAPDNTAPIYIPKLPSMKIIDLAKAIDPACTFKIVGLKPGEKIAEMLCEGYTSDKNDSWLTPDDIREILKISQNNVDVVKESVNVTS